MLFKKLLFIFNTNNNTNGIFSLKKLRMHMKYMIQQRIFLFRFPKNYRNYLKKHVKKN